MGQFQKLCKQLNKCKVLQSVSNRYLPQGLESSVKESFICIAAVPPTLLIFFSVFE